MGVLLTRAAIYLRVSDLSQEAENQRPACEALLRARGWDLAQVYVEEATAWRSGRQAQRRKAYEDARRGKFQVLVVWSLDRLTREGPLEMLRQIDRFEKVGCRVVSVQESWTEVDSDLRDLLLSIVGWVARMESKRRSERTKEGMARAKASGVKLGRPKKRRL